MDNQDEYHDPDYAGTSESAKEDPPILSEEERLEKIRKTIRREFSNELEERENEVMMIDQRMTTSRRLLHQLRYALVKSYYSEQRLQLSAEQIQDEAERPKSELTDIIRDGQRKLHPSVRKLLGARSVNLSEIFKTREPRSRVRPNYSAMVRNHTIAADSATKTLRPAPPEPDPVLRSSGLPDRSRRLPRRYDPREANVLTIDEQTRNKVKHRFRLVIGNTSKYAPPSSRADRSTHKWLLYVRAAPSAGEGGEGGELHAWLKAVVVKLHPSYAPHHTVTLNHPPFQIGRRGWGEFTARVELHFALPHLNPPATVSHSLKLDRNYTGLQTLGAETIVDIWLYSSPEMLKYAYDANVMEADEMENELQRANTMVVAEIEKELLQKEDKKEKKAVKQKEKKKENQTDYQPDEQTDKQAEPLIQIKQEILEPSQDDSWMEFFTRDSSQLNVDEMIIKPTKALTGGGISDDMVMEVETIIKEEPMDFEENFIRDISTEMLMQPSSPKKRIMKYIDPTTGKIYYLEMDRNLDPSTVQEIVLNTGETIVKSPLKKVQEIVTNKTDECKGSPVRNGVTAKKRLPLKNHEELELNKFRHIENDHCYLGDNSYLELSVNENCEREVTSEVNKVKSVDFVSGEEHMAYLESCLPRLVEERTAVYFLLRKIPLVDPRASDPDFRAVFPFVVDSDEKYWKLDIPKRRNMEWSRAKLVRRLVRGVCGARGVRGVCGARGVRGAWSTKHVLVFARLHALVPLRGDCCPDDAKTDTSMKELYRAKDINSLSVFDSDSFKSEVSDLKTAETEADEEVDIVGSDTVTTRCRVPSEGSEVLEPLEPSEEDRMRFLFVEKVCSEIGIELRNEDIGNGYSYSAVHLTLLSAVRSFAEELTRAALAAARGGGSVWGYPRVVVGLQHVYAAAGGPGGGGGRLSVLSSRGLGEPRSDTTTV